MKNAPFPSEVLYVPGGLATAAAVSVDPHEDPEEERLAAIRRSRNRRVARQKRRRKLERQAAKAAGEGSP